METGSVKISLALGSGLIGEVVGWDDQSRAEDGLGLCDELGVLRERRKDQAPLVDNYCSDGSGMLYLKVQL